MASTSSAETGVKKMTVTMRERKRKTSWAVVSEHERGLVRAVFGIGQR